MQLSIKRRMRILLWAGASVGALASAAHAAETSAIATAALSDATAMASVQEVVVVAEKRQTTVQKAPLAITAIPADILAKDNIQYLQDLNGRVPSLTVANSGPFNHVVAIRGIGYDTSDNGSSEPGVSYHVDGVYIAAPFALGAEFVDTQRIEVLRGPQSTVFGQSSTGGAINMIGYKPVIGQFSGDASLSYGTYNLVKTTDSVNIPINDQFALRAAVNYTRHDGFAKELYVPGKPNYPLDDQNDLGGKVSLLWKPTDDFSAILSAQDYYADHNGPAMKSIYDPNPNPREISQDYPNHYYLQFFLGTVDLSWNLPFATFRSLTSYQNAVNTSPVDNDRLAYQVKPYYDDAVWFNKDETITQEFDLSSKSGGRVDWQVGLFYLHEKMAAKFYEFEGTDANPTITYPTSQADLPYNYNYSVFTNQLRDTYAGFGQATVHITPWLRFTGGMRYTYETLSGVTNTDFLLYAPLTFLTTADHALTGKAELDVDVTPHNMIYASWSRGFKPGGVNLNNTPVLAPQIFKAETVTAYELGSKNRFFDNRLTLNGDVFFEDYQNYQYEEEDPIPYQGGVSNVPEAHIWGVEFEGNYAITDTLRLDANVTKLNGQFTQNYIALDPSLAAAARAQALTLGYGPYDPYTIAQVTAAAAQTKGNPVPKMPDWSGSVSLNHTLNLNAGELDSRVEVVYRGSYVYRIFDTSGLDTVKSYSIVNLNFDFKPAGSRFSVSLTATNLFDSAGVESRYSNPFGSFTTDNQYIPPRQVFGTIRYHF
jgi:iron complex outermembrane receptor protein